MRFIFTLYLLSALLMFSHQSWADLNIEIKKSADTHLETLAEVNKELSTVAYSVIILDENTKAFTDVAELIENEVGVQIRKFGAVGSFSTAVLRGSSSQQVVIYLDGVAINTAAIGSVDLSGIDLNDIERIEVYRGATPIELGQASMGGAINLITKKTARNNLSQIKVVKGSFLTRQLTFNKNHVIKNNRIFISGDFLSSKNNYTTLFDNNTEYNLDDDRQIQINNDDVKKQSLFVKWDYTASKNVFFDTRLKLYNKKKQIPNKNNNGSVNTFFSTKNTEFFSQFSRQNLISGALDLNLKFTSKIIEQQFDDSSIAIGSFAQDVRYENNINRLQAFSTYRLEHSQWNLLFALGESKYEFKNQLRAGEKSANQRADIELNIQQTSYWLDDVLIMNLSLRYQKIKDKLAYAIDSFGQPVAQKDKQYSVNQPQLGLKYRIDAASSVLFNAGRYVRVPVFSELFGNQGLFRGNEELIEESGTNIDIGLNYAWFNPSHWYHNTEIYLGLFNNRAKDLIVRVYNAQGVSVAKNINAAEVNGVEWDIKIQPNKHWDVSFNATLMDPRVLSNSTETNNKFIPGQYQQVYSLYTAYSQNKWRLSMQQSLNKNVYWDAPNNRKGDNFYLLNITASKKWFKHIVSLQIDNVGNESYANFDRVWDRPGRSVFLSYQYSI